MRLMLKTQGGSLEETVEPQVEWPMAAVIALMKHRVLYGYAGRLKAVRSVNSIGGILIETESVIVHPWKKWFSG